MTLKWICTEFIRKNSWDSNRTPYIIEHLLHVTKSVKWIFTINFLVFGKSEFLLFRSWLISVAWWKYFSFENTFLIRKHFRQIPEGFSNVSNGTAELFFHPNIPKTNWQHKILLLFSNNTKFPPQVIPRPDGFQNRKIVFYIMKTNLFPERDTNSVHSQAHSNTNSTGKFENYKKI